MADRLPVLGRLRPRIKAGEHVDNSKLAERMAMGSSAEADELYGNLRRAITEMKKALEAGETVNLDDFITISPNMKVGREVNISVRIDKGFKNELNNPNNWSGKNVENYANMKKSADDLIAEWNADNPTDTVTE